MKTCVQCQATFGQPGPGRPSSRCPGCRPRKVAGERKYAVDFERPCVVCGVTIKGTPQRGKPSKYCSATCRGRRPKPRPVGRTELERTATCEQCSVAFTFTGRMRSHCSTACKAAARNKRRREAGPSTPSVSAILRGCDKQDCGQPHYAKSLCKRHYQARQYVPKTEPCVVCGKLYTTTRLNGRVCSLECRWFIHPNARTSCRVPWAQCLCGKWFIKRSVQTHCGCGTRKKYYSYVRQQGQSRTRQCKACQSTVTYAVSTRPPDYCGPCRTAIAKARAETLGKKRRALLRGAVAEKINPQQVYERDGWVCQLCDEPVDQRLGYPHPGSPSLDHVVPLSKGGCHTWDNVQLAHLVCNTRKGNRAA